jgi:hypothetical protein
MCGYEEYRVDSVHHLDSQTWDMTVVHLEPGCTADPISDVEGLAEDAPAALYLKGLLNELEARDLSLWDAL